MTVIDVGANVGTMTMALAAFVGQTGHVFSFEPQYYAYSCLVANVTLNNLLHFVRPFQAAVGDKPGVVEFPTFNPARRDNTGGLSMLDAIPEGSQLEEAPVVTIDSLNLPACHLIKADCEGMEPHAFRGAQETIAKHRPVIWCEQLEGADQPRPSSRPELTEIFKQHNYRAWKFATPLFDPYNSRRERWSMFVMPDGKSMEDHNVLALPREVEPPDWTAGVNIERFVE